MYPYDENSKNCFMICGERSLRHHFRYKYHLVLESDSVQWQKLPLLMLGGLVVILQDVRHYQWFYKELRPWEHYVPVKEDLSDLSQKIDWLRDNDKEARVIGENAKKFARLHF